MQKFWVKDFGAKNLSLRPKNFEVQIILFKVQKSFVKLVKKRKKSGKTKNIRRKKPTLVF